MSVVDTHIDVEYQPPRTVRTVQVASAIDVPLDQPLIRSWHHVLPLDEQQWSVGLIVGPSGAGKSLLAAKAWPHVTTRHDWSSDRALVDDFSPDLPMDDVTGHLTAVGLSSIPAWLRPYRTLSNGEQFRADVARSIAEAPADVPVVVDEFTSVVDRQVAKITSHATQKAIRRAGRQFVAVTCHHDVIDWLQPDWVYDAASCEFTWRSVQPRPLVHLDVHEDSKAAWPLFAPHHYMSATLHTAAVCFTGWIDGEPVAFTSYRVLPHSKARNIMLGHRLVVLPDYQGLGLGGLLDDWLGQYLAERGKRYRNVVAHPAMIAHYQRSPRWREARPKARNLAAARVGPNASGSLKKWGLDTRGITLRSFEYQPPAGSITRDATRRSPAVAPTRPDMSTQGDAGGAASVRPGASGDTTTGK